MTTIRLHNTKTRKKAEFVPIDPKNVRMYVCGPTVYDRAHLGNARPVIVFDVLYRLLRHVYGEDHVTYVRNFTDVDDKINAEAQRRKDAGDARSLEALIRERTDETIGWYHADMDALGALRPTLEPRATEYIGQMVAMIADLIDKDHAYEKDGHVLFRVRSYEAYGKLSGRSVDDMIAGARVEVAPFKEDPMDFVLWKPSTDDLPGWGSPWGRGRPGWHIECSAMSHELLGDSFDIHGGGIDLQFPHHENEIAQSMCAHPEADFAKVWMHNEMLQVEGKKMSKSLGNFFTVRDLLDGNWSGGWKVPGEVVRFVFLQTHYSKPMDWTEEKAREAEAELTEWFRMTEGVVPSSYGAHSVVPHITNDLNISEALTRMRGLADGSCVEELRWGLEFFGLLPTSDWYRQGVKEYEEGGLFLGVSWTGSVTPEALQAARALLLRYANARKDKDYSTADRLRGVAEGAGLKLQAVKGRDAHAEIESNFDLAKLEALK
ncbi:MAG: cysteine--tRNA ligase [Paracoccaceae bacterium]|nr:cysteine--tRNA ligase [Paracoccaceae bacterium]